MIINSFDDKTEPVIGLRDFYGERGSGFYTCIATFSNVIFDALMEMSDKVEVARVSTTNGGIPIYALKNTVKPTAFYLSPIGSTLAAQICIEVNWLTGAKNFIMFGSCGSLDSEATKGKFIIPTEAYRDEGMSYHYAPPADYIKIKNADRLAAIFGELSLPYVKGRVWTTDAMLRETKGQLAKRKSEGCIAVEMELAGVQAVCDFYGFEVWDFLSAGDVLSENDYRVEGLSAANHDLDKLFAALEIANRI